MIPSRSALTASITCSVLRDLRPHLHHAMVTSGRLDHQPPLADIVRARLLDINVFSRFTRQNGGRRVPMVGGCDPHRVDGLVVEDSAQVFDCLSVASGLIAHDLCRSRQSVGVHIAHVAHLYVLTTNQLAQVGRPHATGSDNSDLDLVIGPCGTHRCRAEMTGGEGGNTESRFLEKLATLMRGHDRLPVLGECEAFC